MLTIYDIAAGAYDDGDDDDDGYKHWKRKRMGWQTRVIPKHILMNYFTIYGTYTRQLLKTGLFKQSNVLYFQQGEQHAAVIVAATFLTEGTPYHAKNSLCTALIKVLDTIEFAALHTFKMLNNTSSVGYMPEGILFNI
ncbi:hypothetical protein GQX74_011812 [Glossina fuscipes]|nr:hypothetical protein GQX74_011812 [Glossina fuscipes]